MKSNSLPVNNTMKTVVNNTPHTDEAIQTGIREYIEKYELMEETQQFVFPKVNKGYVVVITNPRLCESFDKWTIFSLDAISVNDEVSEKFASEGSKQDGYAVMILD